MHLYIEKDETTEMACAMGFAAQSFIMLAPREAATLPSVSRPQSQLAGFPKTVPGFEEKVCCRRHRLVAIPGKNV